MHCSRLLSVVVLRISFTGVAWHTHRNTSPPEKTFYFQLTATSEIYNFILFQFQFYYFTILTMCVHLRRHRHVFSCFTSSHQLNSKCYQIKRRSIVFKFSARRHFEFGTCNGSREAYWTTTTRCKIQKWGRSKNLNAIILSICVTIKRCFSLFRCNLKIRISSHSLASFYYRQVGPGDWSGKKQ